MGLSNQRKDGSRSVMLRVTCQGKRTDLYTGVNIQEKQWSEKTQRVKHGCTVHGTPYNVLNDTIDKQITFIDDYFTKKAMLDALPSLDELKKSFNIAFKGKEEEVITSDFFLLFNILFIFFYISFYSFLFSLFPIIILINIILVICVIW